MTVRSPVVRAVFISRRQCATTLPGTFETYRRGLTMSVVQGGPAAVLAADVAGFSRLSGADEDGVLALLRARRVEVINPEVVAHGGRVFKYTGDGSRRIS